MTLLPLLGNFDGVATLGQLNFDHTDFWVPLATFINLGDLLLLGDFIDEFIVTLMHFRDVA